MKKLITLLILPCLFLLLLISDKAFAQGPPLERLCYYESPDACITIGYQSVTPRINTPGGPQNQQLDIEVIFRATCGNVASISVNPIQGNPVIATAGDITGENQTVAFVVNANAFDNDNTLRFTIDFTNGVRTMVDIFYVESLNCGAIFPLPVELMSFKGKATQSGINLEWETASELNNSHFNVERSADGKQYESIGTVRGRGTTSVKSTYRLSDTDPLKGTNYYRLKQVDQDNSYSYSSTIAVKWSTGDAMQITLLPNPCQNGDCKIVLSNMANTETLIQLKDMSGRVVYSKTIKAANQLSELPVADLKQYKGLYFLSAVSGGDVVYQRIVLE